MNIMQSFTRNHDLRFIASAKRTLAAALLIATGPLWAQEAIVDVKLSPAGSFQLKSSDVRGFAIQKSDRVEAKNIIVGLENLDTGISLRNQHAKEKYLQTEKYPDAILIWANGKNGVGEGVIRIHGVEKKINGSYKIDGSNLIADFPLKISDFKIEKPKYMGVGANDDIKVHITVPLIK